MKASWSSSPRRQAETQSVSPSKLCILTNSEPRSRSVAPSSRRTGGRPQLQRQLQLLQHAPTAPCTMRAACAVSGLYILAHILGRLDRHGRAAQGALAPIWPYRVAGARAPAALGRRVAGDGLIPRHDHSLLDRTGRRRMRPQRVAGWIWLRGMGLGGLLAQKGLRRLLHRGGTRRR